MLKTPRTQKTENVGQTIGFAQFLEKDSIMIIDFHTHIFPDSMAKATVEFLKGQARDNGYLIENHADATLDGLDGEMKKSGVDKSVILPIATKIEHFESMNKFAVKVNESENLISFGAIHPMDENYKDRLRQIKDMGLKGIKLHPYFQHTAIDSDEFIRVVEEAVKNDLIVSVHAGLDSGFKTVMAEPKTTVRLVKSVDCSKVILAHMGGCALWDDVEEYLVGENVLFDTSYCLPVIEDKKQFERIVKNHGSGKILFGSDSPWADAKKDIDTIKSLDFSENEKQDILCENARNLLKLGE